MCRIFAAVGNNESGKKLESALTAFRPLADCGCVPVGMTKGHRDGWGVASYRNQKLIHTEKYAADASEDPRYLEMAKKVSGLNPEITIVHFRKASVGGTTQHDAHPFLSAGFAFCHNGSIYGSQKIPLKAGSEKTLAGTTDSERFFHYVIDQISPDQTTSADVLRQTIKKSVEFIRRTLDYTAINILLTDGKTLWVLREINTDNKFVREKNLEDQYYTLFVGTSSDGSEKYISSEKLSLPNIEWRAIGNHELLELGIASKNIEKFVI